MIKHEFELWADLIVDKFCLINWAISCFVPRCHLLQSV